MPCVRPDGTLSGSGRVMLKALEKDATPDEVAAIAGMPLFRVRSALRELVDAGLISESGGRFHRTEQGTTKVRSSD